ncbi:MAG: YceI family protein, partial [Arenimonas sp.]
MTTLKLLLAALTLTSSGVAAAGSVVYKIDPDHTFPSFEADHFGGLSVWRGKFNTTGGTITLDKAGAKGTVDVTVDMGSADFGHDKLNEHARGKDLFETATYPRATYKGKLGGFVGG